MLTGCGGDDDGPAPTAAPTAPPTSPPTAAPTPPAAGAGLVGEVVAVSITGGQVDVTFELTDAEGNPVKPVLTSTQDPQQARVRFTLAHVEEYSGGGDLPNTFLRYINDVNATEPAYDSRGTLSTIDAATGEYGFRFSIMLPAGYDPSETYSVGMQANRTFEGESFAVNQVFDFVPGGGTPIVWTDTTTEQCNACHNPLRAHGSRYEVRLCTLCHVEGATDDEGTSIDFRVMIHKIHAGVDLPSVADGPPGSEYVVGGNVYAEKHEDGSVTGVGFPRTLENCTVCHANAPTAEYYRTKPAAPPCASCHDDVNPGLVETAAGPPGTNHFQNRGYADGSCYACHEAEQGQEFDISVPGAHLVPARSTQLAGVNLEIVDVENHQAGENPTVLFKVTENDGDPITDLSGFNRVAFALAGPTSDYTTLLTPTAVGGGSSGMLTGPDGEGVFSYALAAPIPADATGTWSLGAEARRMVNLVTTPEVSPKSVQEAAVNPVVTFTVDDEMAEMRRVVVDDANCQTCHGEFSLDFSVHGNLRNQQQYCVLCHNPEQSDYARRRNDPEAVAAGSEVATIDYKVLIHKIHRGEDLAQKPYYVYGFGTPPANYTRFDFAEVLFPGNLADCATCHVEDSYLIPPFPGTALPTQQAHIDPANSQLVIDGHLGPITSACTACHDTEEAEAHAQTQTSDGVETCGVCHAEGRIAAVSLAHAGELGDE
jgi:OmcA/MtrC family decaheme c-type cytochrome